MYLGNDLNIDYTINDLDGSTVDLTGASITFSVKEERGATSYVFQRQNTAAGGGNTEIEEIDYTLGTFTVHIIAANTSSLSSGSFVCDVEIETAAGATYTADDFILELKDPVTAP